MKKYSPSIKNNNALKDKALKDLKKVCFKLETHKVNSYLDKDVKLNISNNIKNLLQLKNNMFIKEIEKTEYGIYTFNEIEKLIK